MEALTIKYKKELKSGKMKMQYIKMKFLYNKIASQFKMKKNSNVKIV